MIFRVRTEQRPCAAGLDGTFYILEGPNGNRAEIWPALGFNCVRWTVAGRDWLWSAPDLLQDPRPMRSGIPILFPFPNRIRDGRFSWQGRDYQLPINGPQGKHAIHGFAAYRPWKVIDTHVGPYSARLTARFRGSEDVPECRHLWPADYEITATYRFAENRLSLGFVVSNPDDQDLPFGLGLHPYLRIPAERAQVTFPPLVERRELEGCLPTGRTLPLEGPHDRLRNGEAFEQATFDDLYHVTGAGPVALSLGGPAGVLAMGAIGFPYQVVFTPPHREAICVEPYSCTTDLFAEPEQGLQVLKPGRQWHGMVAWEVTGFPAPGAAALLPQRMERNPAA